MKNDASWAQQHLADGFIAGNSWGDWETKEEFIKDLQNKTNKWKSGNISDVKVATFGPNTAVSHYTFTYDAELQGKHRARTVICSDTWVNDSGTWKTASTHCSMVKGRVAATRRSHPPLRVEDGQLDARVLQVPGLFRGVCFLKMPNDAQRIIAFRRSDEAAACSCA